MPVDFPAGLRVEGRLGLDRPRELAITVSANLDLPVVLGTLGLVAYGIATHCPRRADGTERDAASHFARSPNTDLAAFGHLGIRGRLAG